MNCKFLFVTLSREKLGFLCFVTNVQLKLSVLAFLLSSFLFQFFSSFFLILRTISLFPNFTFTFFPYFSPFFVFEKVCILYFVSRVLLIACKVKIVLINQGLLLFTLLHFPFPIDTVPHWRLPFSTLKYRICYLKLRKTRFKNKNK